MLAASKKIIGLHGSSTTNAATATGNIDTLDFDHSLVDIIMATSSAVTTKTTVLKLQESATTDASNFSDLSGAVGGTDFTIPAAKTAGESVVRFSVSKAKKPHKRYLRGVVSPATTQIISITAELFRGDATPANAAGMGVEALVNV